MKKVVVLVSGLSRAGKDTFSEALMKRCGEMATAYKFAESLRNALSLATDYLKLDVSVWSEDPEEKKLLRPALQAIAEYARTKNEDVFAENTAEEIERSFRLLASMKPRMPAIAVVSDLRHANELQVIGRHAKQDDWQVFWVHVIKEGNPPANAIELAHMDKMLAQGLPDAVYRAAPGSPRVLEKAAEDFYNTFILPYHQQE